MKDRQPLHAGRVHLEPVSGQQNTFDMTMADGATEQGTPLNKATFLKDATAALYGLPNTAVPDDVLSLLPSMINNRAKIETGSYVGTGTYGASNPNSLTFGFVPKLVIVFQDTTSSSNNGFFGRIIMINGAGNASFGAGSSYYLTTMFNDTSVKWYSANHALIQLNYSNGRYVYVAIG